MRRRITRSIQDAVFAVIVSIAPTHVDGWRSDLRPPPARILAVGEPVKWLASRD